jgi:8-oxo-dGTP pyrophosphatase MutT (NUDIX family)
LKKKGEEPGKGVLREVLEETGLRVSKIRFHGVLKHYFGQTLKPDWIVYMFSTREYNGEIKNSEEGF